MTSRFGGHWKIGGAFTDEQSVAVRIDPAFAWSFEDTVGPDDVERYTGQLRATADDGSTLEVSVMGIEASAIADFTVTDATASLSER